jgi:hypothetical protein
MWILIVWGVCGQVKNVCCCPHGAPWRVTALQRVSLNARAAAADSSGGTLASMSTHAGATLPVRVHCQQRGAAGGEPTESPDEGHPDP